ncbi:peptidase, M48 family [Jonquetella anthropi E3_33 E1]|nr:peptidase, M48 family [Jonquetella anthropi E3_33 E1]
MMKLQLYRPKGGKIMNRRTRLTVLVACFLCVGSALWAAVRPEVVQRAWEKTFPLAEVSLPQGSIHYESKTEPNAWVASEGSGYSVHVTEGLMKVLNSEDQIAGVLGHELGHIKLGHFGKTSTRRIAEAGIGLLIYDQLIRKSNSTLTKVLLGAGTIAGGMLAESGFSRQQEIEADAFGVKMLAKAGYNPYGLYDAMMAMKRSGFTTQPNGFNSHPPTERRLKRLKIEAQKYPYKGTKRS